MKSTPSPVVDDPQVTFRFEREGAVYCPGDFLSCQYSVELQPEHDVNAIEASVIWLTEGKGEEDIGVHLFERRKRANLPQDAFSKPHRMSTVLPESPLSYDCQILKIRWCVRVRIFLESRKEVICDQYFQLKSGAPS